MGMIKLPTKGLKFFSENYSEIFESGELSEGKWNKEIAEWTNKYTGSPHSLAVNSNGAGLYLLLRLLKEYKGKKKVFLQSNTMYGVKTIAISSGLELSDYINCSIDYLMPTFDQYKEYVNKLSKPEEYVFLMTHIGGWVNPDIENIADLSREKGIHLIEDCAHSLGSLLNEKHTGLFGDAGVYSLYATKAIPVGEGGIIVTKDEQIHEMAEKFIMYDRFDQKLNVGINLRMSELNALLAYSVLMETEEIIQEKYKISDQYEDACISNEVKYIKPKAYGQRSNLYKFILLSLANEPSNEFSAITKRTSPVYDYVLGNDPYNISSRHICLPIWYKQEQQITDEVIREIDNLSKD